MDYLRHLCMQIFIVSLMTHSWEESRFQLHFLQYLLGRQLKSPVPPMLSKWFCKQYWRLFRVFTKPRWCTFQEEGTGLYRIAHAPASHLGKKGGLLVVLRQAIFERKGKGQPLTKPMPSSGVLRKQCQMGMVLHLQRGWGSPQLQSCWKPSDKSVSGFWA